MPRPKGMLKSTGGQTSPQAWNYMSQPFRILDQLYRETQMGTSWGQAAFYYTKAAASLWAFPRRHGTKLVPLAVSSTLPPIKIWRPFETLRRLRRQYCFWWCGVVVGSVTREAKSTSRGRKGREPYRPHPQQHLLGSPTSILGFVLWFSQTHVAKLAWMCQLLAENLATRRARQQWPSSGQPSWTLTGPSSAVHSKLADRTPRQNENTFMGMLKQSFIETRRKQDKVE